MPLNMKKSYFFAIVYFICIPVLMITGRAGAHTLWSTLRDRSQVKLKYADARIPLELKDAYGAFVRECLTKNKTVAKRSFYSETEVGLMEIGISSKKEVSPF